MKEQSKKILWFHFSVNHSIFYGTFFTAPFKVCYAFENGEFVSAKRK